MFASYADRMTFGFGVVQLPLMTVLLSVVLYRVMRQDDRKRLVYSGVAPLLVRALVVVLSAFAFLYFSRSQWVLVVLYLVSAVICAWMGLLIRRLVRKK